MHSFVYMYIYRDRQERDSTLSNVLRMIGNTPLIRLDKIARSEGLKCDLCKYIGGVEMYGTCCELAETYIRI